MCVSVHAELHWSTSCVMLTSMSGVCKWDHNDLGITSLGILSVSFVQCSRYIAYASVRYVHVKCENWTTTSGELLQVQFYSSDFSLLWMSSSYNTCTQFGLSGAPLGFQEALLHHLVRTAIMIFIVQFRLISTWLKPYSNLQGPPTAIYTFAPLGLQFLARTLPKSLGMKLTGFK